LFVAKTSGDRSVGTEGLWPSVRLYGRFCRVDKIDRIVHIVVT